jgi:hypothetical protein
MTGLADLLRTILDAVGISKMPWVARVYLVLLGIFALLLVFAVSQAEILARAGKALPDSDPAMQLLALCKDGIKLILGAVLGALSPHEAARTDSPAH